MKKIISAIGFIILLSYTCLAISESQVWDYHSFNENWTSLAYPHYTVTPTGAVLSSAQSKNNKSLYCDGNDMVSATSLNAKFDPSVGFVSFWAYPTATTSYQYFIGAAQAVVWTDQFRVIRNNGNLYVGFGTNIYVVTSPIPENAWTHIIVSWNNSMVYAWKNGSLVANFSTPGLNKNLWTGGIAFCINEEYNNHYYTGYMDEMAWGNVSLTSDMASQLYNNGQGLLYPFSGEIQNINCTSCNIPYGDAEPPYTTFDTTPTFTFQTTINAQCRIANANLSYTAMGSSRQCTSGEGTSEHICTLTAQDALANPTSYVYLACQDSGSNQFYSGPLQMEISDGDSGILMGIYASAIWPGSLIYSDQQVYVRTINNDQALARFDKVAVYGNQRWAFNFITVNENSIGQFYNLSPVFYFMEMSNISGIEARDAVTALINSTKI